MAAAAAGERSAAQVYRALLQAAALVRPAAQSVMMVTEIREEFRRGRAAEGEAWVPRVPVSPAFRRAHRQPAARSAVAGLDKAVAQLAYIESTLPRVAKMRLEERQRASGQRAGHAYVVRDGQVQEGSGQARGRAPHSQFGAGNLDPDQLARHNASLRRFKFMDRGTAAPRGPQWAPDR